MCSDSLDTVQMVLQPKCVDEDVILVVPAIISPYCSHQPTVHLTSIVEPKGHPPEIKKNKCCGVLAALLNRDALVTCWNRSDTGSSDSKKW